MVWPAGQFRYGSPLAFAPRDAIEEEERAMVILSWILFGLVVGIIAKLLMPGRDPGGFIITILLGIAGALVGGFIGRAMGFYGANQSAGWIVSILGAIILLALYRMMVRRRV
jgi:uncharacterized membrane protein YeaQ/YmgE (transglycosylase-associated protein family)